MKELINKIIFIITISIIGVFSIWFLLKKPILFSENENRYLTMFPKISLKSLAEGKLTSKIEEYINDQFPLRDFLVGIKTNVEILLGKTKINDIYIGKDNYLIPTFNKNNNFQKIIDTLNTFENRISVPVDLIIAPNSIEIYSEKLPINDEKNNGIKEIEKIYNSYDGNVINVHEILLKNKLEYDLYYRTDHHWTTYGAYYAYNEYIRQIGKDKKLLSNYNINLISSDFYGTSYSKANYYSLPADDIYLFEDNFNYKVNYVVENKIENSPYNTNYLNKKDKYSVFLDNNHALIEIDNLDNSNGENLLLVKNSYGNSFAPFIAADFDTVSVIDLRYYKTDVSAYVQENNITRVLILYDINGIYTDPSIYKLR